MTKLVFFLFFATICNFAAGQTKIAAKYYIHKGWSELIQDNDTLALKYFGEALELAKREKNTEEIAVSLLHMGICYYSVSYSKGLEYAFEAMAEYKKLESSDPIKAIEGRSKCLLLISTISIRQGKYKEAIELTKEAMPAFISSSDTSGYLGLIYNSLGLAYKRLNISDSSEYFHRKALQERIDKKNFTYQPSSYLNVADIEMQHGNKAQSRIFYDRAIEIADSTKNRQSLVSSYLGIGRWYHTFEKNEKLTEDYFQKAKTISESLSDKSYYLNVLEQLIFLRKEQKEFLQALNYQQEIIAIKDTLNSWEKQRMVKSLEIQFDVSEKDRQLKLIQKEKDITNLTNYLLWGTIGFLIIISIGIILFLRRINKRDKILLQTKEQLVIAIENQKKLREQQMQNEIEFKESQLSAMTFQMLQKNELMHELKESLEKNKDLSNDNSLNKIISKGQNHDKDWTDFNTHFESINKNFYSKLKQAYPDISPNDLKICALIKLNLSIKEMASILNISPDSVKTARYRLRKKLQLNTEDNLTEFIMGLV